MECIIKEKKWSNGEKCEKSYKKHKPIFDSNNKIIEWRPFVNNE